MVMLNNQRVSGFTTSFPAEVALVDSYMNLRVIVDVTPTFNRGMYTIYIYYIIYYIYTRISRI